MSEQGMSAHESAQSGHDRRAGESPGAMASGGMGQGQTGMGPSGVEGMAGPQQGMHHGHHPYFYGMPGMAPGHPPYVPYGDHPGLGRMDGPQHGHGMAQAMQEIANGGGIGSLAKLFDLDDREFWKGALVGAAAVLLLTNEGVQRALFRGAVKGRDAVEAGVEKVKKGVQKARKTAEEAEETDDE